MKDKLKSDEFASQLTPNHENGPWETQTRVRGRVFGPTG